MAVLKVPPRISTEKRAGQCCEGGSFTAQAKNWAQYLSRLMNELTHNFAVLMSELAGIDVELVARNYLSSVPHD
jgi:hypothetical protein